MVVPPKRWGNFNYENPKPLAGGDLYSSYGEYNVHMGGGVTLFFKKVTSTFFPFFTFSHFLSFPFYIVSFKKGAYSHGY